MRKLFFVLSVIFSTSSALLHLNKSPILKTSKSQRLTTIRLPQFQALPERESESASSVVEGFTTLNRALMAGIAIAGSAETAVLTYSKVTNTPIASVVGDLCTSREACTHVLDGPYATIPFLNVPLSALGCVAYTAVALLAIAPSLGNIITTNNSKTNSNNDQTSIPTSSNGNDDANARSLLLLLTSGMAAFSVYLMAVLGVVVQETCIFCYTSAALSMSLAALAWTQRIVPRPNQALALSLSSVSLTSVASAFLFYVTSTLSSGGIGGGGMGVSPAMASTAPAAEVLSALESISNNSPPLITKKSSVEAMDVGRRLQRVEAKMYGAFWCSHCNNQKQALGREVYDAHMFQYIECDKEGINQQYAICAAKKIPGFPTWEILGKYYPGEKDVDELKNILDDAGVP